MKPGRSAVKQAVHDELEARINLASSRLRALTEQAETIKADSEITALVELLPKRDAIERKLHVLKASSNSEWERIRSDLEAHLAEFEKHLRQIEPKGLPD